MSNTDTMPAGPELDALVAERVMGWGLPHYHVPEERLLNNHKHNGGVMSHWHRSDGSMLIVEWWHPSTDIAAAKETLDPVIDGPLAARHHGMGSVKITWSPYGCCWDVKFSWSDGYCIGASAEELELAICRVGIKAAKAAGEE